MQDHRQEQQSVSPFIAPFTEIGEKREIRRYVKLEY